MVCLFLCTQLHACRSKKFLDNGLIVAAAAFRAAACGTSHTPILLHAASALHLLGDGLQALQKTQLHPFN